jgi:hypothetical protein
VRPGGRQSRPVTLLLVSGFESAIFEWREGQQRLRDAEPADRAVLERVTGRIVDELRRRLGGVFTTGELAGLYYEQGTDWCLDIAVEAAPDNPRAWEAQTVADAAFARYVREAADFAGGRRVAAD